MQFTEGLDVKPFLGGGSLDVDHALDEILLFGALIDCLPCGPGSLLLDVGAGPCWVSDWLQKLKFRTISLDLSEDMLRIGRKRLAPGSFLCVGDMAALPLRDGSVDAVVCYSALHHVPNWRDALKEFHRVVRPGGVLVLQEPGKGHHDSAVSRMEMEQFGVLEQDLPPRMLARACRAAGFTRAIVRPPAELGTGRNRVRPWYPYWRRAPRVFVHKMIHRIRAEIRERLVNLVSPMHIVVAMKGEPWPDSRRPDTMVARFLGVDCPRQVSADVRIPVRARILNTGLTRWLAKTDRSTQGQVRLGVSLYEPGGKLLNLDFEHIDLPHDVTPGAAVEISGEVPPIAGAGRYVLRFDLVAEGICWFVGCGTIPQNIEVEVRHDDQR